VALAATLTIAAVVGPVMGSRSFARGASGAAGLPSGFIDKPIATGLEIPTAFSALPDGRIAIAEKSGVVRLLVDGSVRPEPLIDISDLVNDYYERGLLGLAVDPDFEENGFIYLLFTYENDPADYEGPKTARLSRFTVEGKEASVSSEEVLLGTSNGAGCAVFPQGTDCLPAESSSHTVGAIEFAADGTLFVTNGDGAPYTNANLLALRAQNIDSFAGKLLHVTRSGEGLETNPFYDGDVDSNRSKVWAYGLRNPFRFDLRGGTVPYVGDVGSDAWEEINVARSGANLGWPCYEGDARLPRYESFAGCQALYAEGPDAVALPLAKYGRSTTGAAITGGVFYTASSYPRRYRGAYFFADHIASSLSYLAVDDENALKDGPQAFASGLNGPVDLDVGPTGDLYYLAINTGELHRIRYTTSPGAKFSDPTLLNAESNPHSVAIADIDDDGDEDLVAGNAGTNSVGIYLGDDSGGFPQPVQYPVAGRVKYALPVDVNGDGDIDVVTANESTNNVSTLIGNGDGTFEPGADFGACISPHEVMQGDLNEDSSSDLVVSCPGGGVSVLLNNGDGTFAPKVNYTAGSAPHSATVADLNEDGNLDVTVANRNSNNLSLLSGNGDGTFDAPLNLATAPAPHEVRSADLNGDGHLDLISANDGSDSLSVLIAEGGGLFASAVTYLPGKAPMSVAVADYDGDGIKDLATANSAGYPSPLDTTSIGLLLGNGDGTFEPATQLAAGPHPFSIAGGDLNSDGGIDLAIANFNVGSNVAVYVNRSGDEPPPDEAGGGGSTVSHARSVSFRIRVRTWFGSAVGRVLVDDGTHRCLSSTRVNIKRRGRIVARTTTSRTGTFRVALPLKRGRFVAVAPIMRIDGVPILECLRARSPARSYAVPTSAVTHPNAVKFLLYSGSIDQAGAAKGTCPAKTRRTAGRGAPPDRTHNPAHGVELKG
jgi:glucose/arabinose dehydrogenase